MLRNVKEVFKFFFVFDGAKKLIFKGKALLCSSSERWRNKGKKIIEIEEEREKCESEKEKL